MKKYLAYTGAALALPFIAFAQTTQVTSLQTLGQFLIQFINSVLVPVVFALAFIVFIFGIFQFFILGRGDEEAQGKGKSLMIWGLIGFFIMVSVWGLVNVLTGTLGLNPNPTTYPKAPYSTGL